MPIYKRIGKVMSKRQKNVDLLKAEILEQREEKQKLQEQEYLEWKKMVQKTKKALGTSTNYAGFGMIWNGGCS